MKQPALLQVCVPVRNLTRRTENESQIERRNINRHTVHVLDCLILAPSCGWGPLHTAIDQLKSMHLCMPMSAALYVWDKWIVMKGTTSFILFSSIFLLLLILCQKNLSESHFFRTGSICLRWDWSKCHLTIHSLLIETCLPLYLFR